MIPFPFHQLGATQDEDTQMFSFNDIPLLFSVVCPQPDTYYLCMVETGDDDNGSKVQLHPDPNDQEQTTRNLAESVLFLLVTYPDIDVEQLRSLVNSHPPIKEIVDRVSPARYTITDPHVRRVFCALTVNGT